MNEPVLDIYIQPHLLHLKLIIYKASGWTVSRRQPCPAAKSSARLVLRKQQAGIALEVTQGLSGSVHTHALF